MSPRIVKNEAWIFRLIEIGTYLKFQNWSFTNVQKKIVNLYFKLRSFNS
jgi:hypothetical protein